MCDLMSHRFLLLHLRHTCVPFKLWVICTISVFQNIKAMEGRRSKIENGKAKIMAGSWQVLWTELEIHIFSEITQCC